MKRFVTIESPSDGADPLFAFFDTVTDRFEDLGGEQSWGSWLDFFDALATAGRRREAERFRALCPPWVGAPLDGHCPHPGAAKSCCVPRVGDGRCIWCERDLPVRLSSTLEDRKRVTQLVLSLFPGADLLGMAFEAEGFCVVQGPDKIFGRTVKGWHPPRDRFDGIIGGPPCQRWSRMRHIIEANGYQLAEDLIPEFVRVVEETMPTWFLMENVEGAPLPEIPGYVVTSLLLNNRSVPELPGATIGPEQNRLRRFSFGTCEGWEGSYCPRRASWTTWSRQLHPDLAVFESPTYAPAVCAKGNGRAVPVALGGSGKVKSTRRVRAADNHSAKALAESLRLQGLPADFLAGTPFTVDGKHLVVGNGVPLPLGRAIARAVREAVTLASEQEEHRG